MPTGKVALAWIFRWINSELVRNANKLWEVALPPNSGMATVNDSKNKVTIDLSKVKFAVGGAAFPTTDGDWIWRVTAGIGGWIQVTADVNTCDDAVKAYRPGA